MKTAPALDAFETNRQFLLGLAYRLLGRYTEAEDLVQETYLKWHQFLQKHEPVHNPRAYLSKVLTRLCLDYLKSARVRREEYVGPWLPEPILEGQLQPSTVLEVDTALDGVRDLSYALMLTLERLSPLERAVFILHDLFSVSFAELSDILERTEAACRQLASRARKNIQQDKPRFQPSQDILQQLLPAFVQASTSQNAEILSQLLAQDARLFSDGGGVIAAALRPINGAEHIIRFYCGIYEKNPSLRELQQEFILLNGMPGIVTIGDNTIVQASLFELNDAGQISALYAIRNPYKLSHLKQSLTAVTSAQAPSE